MFNDSSEAVSYVNTKSNWTEFVNNVADYAVGGPTLTMFANSWNDKYPDSAITVTGSDTNGWEINGRGYADIDNGDSLYYKENMWYLIGSKYEGDDIYPIYVKDGEICGEVIITPEYGTIKYQGMGFRPIVCVKEGITYEAVGNYFKITTEQDGDEEVDEDENIVVNTSNATINGGVATYNNPIVPCGFAPMNTEEATWDDNNNDGCPDGWNNGLVIRDSKKNEFVWVPIDTSIMAYDKKFMVDKDNYCIQVGAFSIGDSELPENVTSETTQIQKYGGFYVGRYEAGISNNLTTPANIEGVPVTKKEAVVWTDISHNNAKKSAEKMYNNNFVKSGLVTFSAGVSVSEWMVSKQISNIKLRCECGNYAISRSPANVEGYGQKQTSGYSEYWKVNNIYDYYGNISEYIDVANEICFLDSDYMNWLDEDSTLVIDGFSTDSDREAVYESSGFRVMLFLN